MFGGGGMNPRKMKQMMKQMGIDVSEIDADEVIIRTGDEELVFSNAQVTQMDAQGQQTYQIVGEPESRALGAGSDAESATDADSSASDAGGDEEIPDSDVEIVAMRAGVSEDEAREALEAENGDLAAAISRFE
ncbi:Nascent polypeptide-associated complex protein [Haloprofundus marisrubri]|uniref:Nascent polypeptide-associated complex protein n=1 Tax=Haloprofundus marisrubri TaxID=1514971 RepID=A0A0W1RA43_9EURY|nr:nascent polypeptide-associated complex protein [Haloprofundus marisrubri]KTG10219.1 Nascent polypeptide-associated complex protein [Haloprofundus marisrubri]